MATGTNTVISHVKCRDLHKVIRSLTRGQNYGLQKQLPALRLQLYHVYRGMEDYDASKIHAAFPDHNAKTLHGHKILLLNQIVRYVLDTTPHNGMRDLSNMIAEAKVMYKASQNAVALDRVENAIEQARALDAMPELLDALKLRRRLLDSLGIKSQDVQEYPTLELYALKGIEENYLVESLYSSALAIRTLSMDDQLAPIAELEERMKQATFPNLVRNKIIFLSVLYFLARQRFDTPRCIQVQTEIFDLVNSNLSILGDADLRESYLNVLRFLSVVYADEKDFVKAEFYLRQLSALAKRWGEGKSTNPNLYSSIVYTEIWLKIATKDWNATKEMTKKIYKEVVQEGCLDGVSTRPSVLRIGALASYLNKDYGTARNFLRTLKECLFTINAKYNQHLWASWTGLVYLLSYLDEEDPYLRTAHKEISSWFKLLRVQGPFESLLMDFFQKANEEEKPKATTPSLLHLRNELELLYQNPRMIGYKDMFPMLAWIDAKCNGTDLRLLDLG